MLPKWGQIFSEWQNYFKENKYWMFALFLGPSNILAYGCRAWNLNSPIRVQQAGKTQLSWIQYKLTRKASKSGKSSHWKRQQIFRKMHSQFQNPHHIVKRENYETFCRSLQASNLAPMSGNLLIVRASPGRIKVLSFWTKYVVPREIKLRILEFWKI